MSRDKEKGMGIITIKSNPIQTVEKQYQRSSHTVVKVLNPMSGLSAWGSDKGTRNPQGI